MPTPDGGFVVIVEDDTYSIEVLGHFLEIRNITYHVCADREAVIAAMQSFPVVDAVFVDLELSSHDGYEVLKVIKNSMLWNQIPIVAYTSHTHQKSQARDAGFHSFLGKPLDSNVFPDQLHRNLNNQPVWD